MTGRLYRPDIDGLRTLAVVPVVMNHAAIAGFSGGFVGVDVFFVISGYLITAILAGEIDEGRFSIVRFYERRARRILPALFVVLVACLILGWQLFAPARFESLGKSVTATLFFGSNFKFWHGAGDYFGSEVELEPLLHTWSLAVEEQFYLFFPLLLWTIAKFQRRMWIFIVAMISGLSLSLSIWMTAAYPIANFYLVPTRAWELGAGALLALGAISQSNRWFIHEIAGWIGLSLVAGSIALMDSTTPFPGLTAFPSVVGATLIIYAGMWEQTNPQRVFPAMPN